MFRTIPTVVLGSLVSILLASPLSARAQGVVLPLPEKDQQEITTHLGPGVVGAAVPSKPVGGTGYWLAEGVYYRPFYSGGQVVYQIVTNPS